LLTDSSMFDFFSACFTTYLFHLFICVPILVVVALQLQMVIVVPHASTHFSTLRRLCCAQSDERLCIMSTTTYQDFFFTKKGDRTQTCREKRLPLKTVASSCHFVTTKQFVSQLVVSAPWERVTSYKPTPAVLVPERLDCRTTQQTDFVSHHPYAPPRPHIQEPLPKLPGTFETTLNSTQRLVMEALREGSVGRTISARPPQPRIPQLAFQSHTTYQEEFPAKETVRATPISPGSSIQRQRETRDFLTTKAASFLPPVSPRQLDPSSGVSSAST
jgi:hypothetical protein